ncbi:MAG: AmmeMemoRadiSam system radical SAM enzyme [Patescibacteria group bacterium]|nr:AmmeMemoRadiSam system radical SAM enzyme [Patescibacteria group bacterium]MBU1160807.1 AmmeMemoRadiSam system radical SAM enzyme [Patescibacteria group bacterium]MBU1349615.1 AmmeMemoRadiSam system radical SAM enzyme [Patescibacteria group bacterium]MBU1420921.1 AmmeMemoRadiSam system radical SAM enzyme [Patescibacteria group bacterium]MBU1683958.1 AmmeMemoRadiSam system radical SAM enzyme [Patescibacteria group bacterium]
MKTTFLYKPLKDKTVLCLACCHRCKISEGKTGICGVRQNIGNKLKLLVFNKAAAINIDPIEKKPFYHFLPASKTFSIGTFGCNFRCLNCQNYDISQILNHKGDVDYYSKINFGKNLSPVKAIQEAKKTGCKSIAYTYNEPTIWAEYALEIMKRAKKEGLCNIWVSNGFMSEKTFNAISPYLDAVNIDIKSFSDKFYRQNCGARLDPILENCRRVKKKKIHLEITTLIIPTISDNEKMLKQLAKFIKQDLGADVPWHISAFFGEISWKLQHIPETSVSQLKKIYQIGRDAGLHYVYIGNV